MNNPHHLLVSSVVEWFRRSTRAQGVINHIHDLLDLDEDLGPLDFTPREMFRPDRLVTVNSKNRRVPAAAERLIHWSGDPPDEVFWRGLRPRVEPARKDFPDDAFKLSTYVSDNHPSIFISTTQPYRTSHGPYHWRERDRVKAAYWDRPKDYEYEIFAYGGIDVNRVLGDHIFKNQHEIAFPGGIRSEFIRAAREYRTQKTIKEHPNGQREVKGPRKAIKIHRNDFFNPRLTPPEPRHWPGRHLPPRWKIKKKKSEAPVP